MNMNEHVEIPNSTDLCNGECPTPVQFHDRLATSNSTETSGCKQGCDEPESNCSCGRTPQIPHNNQNESTCTCSQRQCVDDNEHMCHGQSQQPFKNSSMRFSEDVESNHLTPKGRKRLLETQNTDLKRQRSDRRVSFDSVTIYWFDRAQGFSCVPSQGGSTLGMSYSHIDESHFSVAHFDSLRRSLHRQILLQHVQQGRLPPATLNHDTDQIDSYYFLQPLAIRQRRTVLKQSGVNRIEAGEKDECKMIRMSREACGCSCEGVCDPATCLCSLAGIACQVDRMSFPCGCTKQGCRNLSGRMEFNPGRVRNHFLHTILRLRKNLEASVESSTLQGSCKDCMEQRLIQEDCQQRTQEGSLLKNFIMEDMEEEYEIEEMNENDDTEIICQTVGCGGDEGGQTDCRPVDSQAACACVDNRFNSESQSQIRLDDAASAESHTPVSYTAPDFTQCRAEPETQVCSSPMSLGNLTCLSVVSNGYRRSLGNMADDDLQWMQNAVTPTSVTSVTAALEDACASSAEDSHQSDASHCESVLLSTICQSVCEALTAAI